jgi:hypothetical protein
MRHAERLLRIVEVGLVVAFVARGPAVRAEETEPAAAPAAPAETAPAAEPLPVVAPRRTAIGWAIGNGLGFLSGDVSRRVAPRVGVELQLAYAHEEPVDHTAYAIAPIVRAYLEPEGSSFYAAAGVSVAWKSERSSGAVASFGPRVSWVSYAAFANLGHEWRWPSGLGIRLGAGMGWRPERSGGSGERAWHEERYRGVNLEGGLRYWF